MMDSEQLWMAIGFVGQALFGSRFVIQWICSERERRSVVPQAFWYLSVLGGLTLLSYAVWRLDPVFIAGQALGVLVYGRNLHLLSVARRAH